MPCAQTVGEGRGRGSLSADRPAAVSSNKSRPLGPARLIEKAFIESRCQLPGVSCERGTCLYTAVATCKVTVLSRGSHTVAVSRPRKADDRLEVESVDAPMKRQPASQPARSQLASQPASQGGAREAV